MAAVHRRRLPPRCRPDRRLLRPCARCPTSAPGGLPCSPSRAPPGRAVGGLARSCSTSGRRAQLPGGPAAVTANLLVRAAAWRSVGGFLRGRPLRRRPRVLLAAPGRGLELDWRYRDGARRAPAERRFAGLIAPDARATGAGNAWQNRRRPGRAPAPARSRGDGPRMSAVGLCVHARGRFEQASMSAVDGVALSRQRRRPRSTATRRRAGRRRRRCAIAGGLRRPFPGDLGDLRRQRGAGARGRAAGGCGSRPRRGPQRPLLGGAREWRVDYLEDEGASARAAALAWLSPATRCAALADLGRRRRWPHGRADAAARAGADREAARSRRRTPTSTPTSPARPRPTPCAPGGSPACR